MSNRQIKCTCSECGKGYTITFEAGNPYFCPECDKARRVRISSAFAKTGAAMKEREAAMKERGGR